MPGKVRRRGWAVAWCLVAGSALCPGQDVAAPRRDEPTRVVLRERHAVIREPWQVTLTALTNTVQFPGLSLALERGVVHLADRRREVQVLEWRAPASPSLPAPRVNTAGRAVTVEAAPANAGLLRPGVARIASGSPGNKRFDLIYAVTGLSVSVRYDVLVRGSLTNLAEPMSIDVDGWYSLANESGMTWEGVTLQWISADTQGRPPSVKPPGILELDEDSPLSDAWRFTPDEPGVPHRYLVGTNLVLPDRQTVLLPLMSVARRPVDRILLLRAEEIPTDSRTARAQPSQIISFRNAAESGRARSMPPGPAVIHVGSQRSTLFQRAWFNHTPAQGEIRIDMGKVDGVQARRIARGRVNRADGGYEQTYELRIENALDTPVRVVVDEQPPVSLSWTFLRSNHAFNRQERRMVYTLEVGAKSERVVQYAVRVMMPGE